MTSHSLVVLQFQWDIIGLFPFLPQEHHIDMEAKAPAFQDLEDFGAELIGTEHPASPEIEEKLQAVRLERDDLEKAWEKRKKMLDQCLQWQVEHVPHC